MKKNRIAAALLAVLLAVSLFVAPPQELSAAYYEGSRGDRVKEIQQKLSEWGYYDGAVDGIFGSATAAAVKKFQRKNGLTVDGIVGDETLRALGMSGGGSGGSGNSSGGTYQANIDLLARMIAAEGRGEPYKGQVAIGAVIMNRVSHPSFPNSLAGVLYQRGAFSALDDGQFYNTSVPDISRRAAVEAYAGSDPTSGCVYYYNPAKTTNRWMLSLPVYLVIGEHYFCKPS